MWLNAVYLIDFLLAAHSLQAMAWISTQISHFQGMKMTIWVKTKIKRPNDVKLSAINHIYWHPFEKKSLDNILLDANECIATKKMVKNTILIFDYSWLPTVRQYKNKAK